MTRPAGVHFITAAVALLWGCGRLAACGEKPHAVALATVVETQGNGVQRDHADRREDWLIAVIGAKLYLGDGVRALAPSRALLSLADGASLAGEPGATVRFELDTESGSAPLLQVVEGEATVRAGGRDYALHTRVGSALLKAGSELRLGRAERGLAVRVTVGEAHFRGAQGQSMELRAGEDAVLDVGMAVLRPPQATQAAPSVAAEPPDAGVPDAGVPDADEQAQSGDGDEAMPRGVSELGPERGSFAVRAGESFTVHAPELPVAVAFELGGKCKAGGVVEAPQLKQRSRPGSSSLLLPAGTRSYVVRCLDRRGEPGRTVARGVVHVVKDAGTRTLPSSAPTSTVDADGHEYTIYYQNQLPNVRVRWPNAPSAGSYELELDGKSAKVPAPEHVFRSGSLRDGVHRVTFEAEGRKSRTTKIEVRFDNAAPTASLTSPKDRGFSPGETVPIEGVLLRSWKASVSSGTIEIEDGDRFHGQVATSAEHPDIAVRLTHPRLGTHYYLRRAASSR